MTTALARYRLADSKLPGNRLSGVVKFANANYTFRELSQWRTDVGDAILNLPEVAWLDLDEAVNKLVIGIDVNQYATGVEKLRALMAAARVPNTAYTVEPASKLERLTGLANAPSAIAESGNPVHLSSGVRPLQAGFEIRYDSANVTNVCTLGYLTKYYDTPVAITASHCSQIIGTYSTPYETIGSGDGTWYAQGSASIGTEFGDVPRWECSYSGGCFWADANLIELDAETASLIATTNGLYADIDMPHHVVWEVTNSTQGLRLHKLGRTTGLTTGTVDRTCVDYSSHPRLYCADTLPAGSGPGDSGGPVFSAADHPGSDAVMAGIVSGRTYHFSWNAAHYDVVFSPMTMIRQVFIGLAPPHY